MNFFEHQALARKNTRLLIPLFLVAIAGMIIALYLVVAYCLPGVIYSTTRQTIPFYWNPHLFLWISIITIGLIAYGSLVKLFSLRKGGCVVATSLGGCLINPDSKNVVDIRARNVVAEVAIASGVSTPGLYVLEEESGINAFAAGFTPESAVIGVTRGCLESLERDELQGVIAHEFSHILNGDIRLNIYLMGILNGLSYIDRLGRQLIVCWLPDSDNVIATGIWVFPLVMPLITLGVFLIMIGSIGVVVSRLVKSLISCQREFLADASAVQFTRKPQGLAGALLKIYQSEHQSVLTHAQAKSASHMFISDVHKRSFLLSSLLSTHPPIPQRMRRLGVSPRMLRRQSRPQARTSLSRQTSENKEPVLSLSNHPTQAITQPESIFQGIGTISQSQLDFAQDLMQNLSSDVKALMSDEDGGFAIILALSLDQNLDSQTQELKRLHLLLSESQYQAVIKAISLFDDCDSRYHLPLVDLIISNLRHQNSEPLEKLQLTIRTFSTAQIQPRLTNYAIQLILNARLKAHHPSSKVLNTKFKTVKQVWPDCVTVLSALAIAGQEDPSDQQYVLREGLSRLDRTPSTLPEEVESLNLQRLEASLTRLEQTAPKLKQQIVHTCIHTALTDGTVTVEESELLRAIVIALGCPMPPILTSFKVSSRAA